MQLRNVMSRVNRRGQQRPERFLSVYTKKTVTCIELECIEQFAMLENEQICPLSVLFSNDV